MTIDVYDDHIRFLGYRVPLDTSKLPPTTRDALVNELQGGVDAVEDGTDQDAIREAEKDAAQEARSQIRANAEALLAKIEKKVDLLEDAISGIRELLEQDL